MEIVAVHAYDGQDKQKERLSRRIPSFWNNGSQYGRIPATVGLVPTRRNRFGALDSAVSRPNLLRSSGPRPLNAEALWGLGFGSTPNLLRSLGLKAQLRVAPASIARVHATD